jgi:chemotaxis protein methyltransferase WspC
MKAPRKLEPAVLQAIAARLAESAGIEPSMLEARRVEWTVERRSKRLHLANGAEYLALLVANSDELAELVDELLIQETRFFRDPAVFEQIAAWARSTAYTAQNPLRVLSAPCSTGQEAYSLAATLAHAGLPSHSFVIDAFDLSSKAIAHARTGVYPEGTLKHALPVLADACGEFRSHHWHMHQALRDRIHFERRNLIQPDALGCKPGYHLILCRNLVIYLHAQARAMLGSALAQALLPGGRLIVGAADRVPELDAFFAPVGPASSFAFTHKYKEPVAQPAPVVCVQDSAQATRAGPPRLRADEAETTAIPATAAELYRRAREYYGRGNLRQAERRCRQALYLAPEYLAALELLQDLWQLNPNLRLRRALRERIRRACLGKNAAGGVTPALPVTAEGGTA